MRLQNYFDSNVSLLGKSLILGLFDLFKISFSSESSGFGPRARSHDLKRLFLSTSSSSAISQFASSDWE